MFETIKKSFQRKIARRKHQEYETYLSIFWTNEFPSIDFFNWQNPLVSEKKITQNHLNFFKQFIKPGDMAIDIGANIGHISILMSLVAGPDGVVLSFDPNPIVLKYWRKMPLPTQN